MRYGIISDIHGNLEALEATIEALSHERIDEYLCAGDIVGYGADPGECINKTKALKGRIVSGNHDTVSIGLMDTRYFNESARAAVRWTSRNLSEQDTAFLQNLDYVYKNRDLTLVHGTLQEPEMFHYMLDENAALGTLGLLKTQICFVGHTHVPGIFSFKKNGLRYSRNEKVKLSRGEKAIVNAGSTGQPRDSDPRSCYFVYDTDKRSIELKRVSYDVTKAQKKIKDAGLPAFLAYRLGEGV